MRPKTVTVSQRRFAFAEPVLIAAMLSLIGMLVIPKIETLRVQAREKPSAFHDLNAKGNGETRVEIPTPAEADLPAGVRFGSYGFFGLDELW
jgi:hypothetical protein